MSFGEHNTSLHASDLVPPGRTSSRGGAADEENRDSRSLRAENEHLRQCLRLMQEQAELESANLISSVIAWCDDRFRKKFADMSLATSSGRKAASPFRPIAPPGTVKALDAGSKISPSDYMSTVSTFSNLTPPSSPVRSFNRKPEEINQSYPAANGLSQRMQPPQPSLSKERSYSPTLSSSRQRQNSPTGTLPSDGVSGLSVLSTTGRSSRTHRSEFTCWDISPRRYFRSCGSCSRIHRSEFTCWDISPGVTSGTASYGSGRNSPVGTATNHVSSRASSRASSPNSVHSSTLQEPPARGSNSRDIQAEIKQRPPSPQFYPALSQFSSTLPTESDVAAAYVSQFPNRSNFSGTLEMHDLSSTKASLKRPESAPFVPYAHESSFPGQQPYASPNQSLIQSTTQGQPPHGVRPSASPQHQLRQVHIPRSSSPTQGSKELPYQNQAAIPQDQSTFQSPAYPGLSYSAQPTLPAKSVVVNEEYGRERTLTPIPEMKKTLTKNMSNIVEEMEEELKGLSSRSVSPAEMISISQKYGPPKAASTPKKGRTSPRTIHSLIQRDKKRKLLSPRGSRSPSPVSDDSARVPVRRNTAAVKPSYRILGEIAFQLERRILDYVFARNKPEDRDRAKRRFYGYTVSNIPFMIAKEVRRHDGSKDDQLEFKLNYRLRYTVTTLGPYGYKLDRHGIFAQEMINKYGLLSNAPDRRTLEAFGLADADTLRGFVSLLSETETEKKDNLILLECLMLMAHDDGRAVFLW
ncbi:LOW QUALITY PROTEIN: uncharacterized protein LOC124292376 [Haliotis rubra]|uniref:LOW QUALITY PROTEIN: uncharacterized protein LOC124292376 n=1 Tax=Haliotis rubra TaxID=36100 RepID=UPI001EE535BA|nr:LOW QUALITY PROTEIN: uncharacterized protein LOC124292376 [Haliotis rubra]